MIKDFLIISGKWHDGLYCLTREGIPGGVYRSRFITLKSPLFPFDIFCTHFSPFVFVIDFFFDLCHFFFVFLMVLQISMPPFRILILSTSQT